MTSYISQSSVVKQNKTLCVCVWICVRIVCVWICVRIVCVSTCVRIVCVWICVRIVRVWICVRIVCVCEYVSGERERGFKELAHVVVEVSWVQTLQSRLKTKGRAAVAGWVLGHSAVRNPLLHGRSVFFSVKTCNWLEGNLFSFPFSLSIMKGNLLYSKSTELNVNVI